MRAYRPQSGAAVEPMFSGPRDPEGDFAVGEYRVRPLEGLVETPAGLHQRLEPKAIGVLACLADRPGKTVTKRVLFERVWSDAAVTEHVLTRCISQLRNALGDDGQKQEAIQTVYKRGYRLLLPVTFPAPADSARRPAAATPPESGPADVTEALGYRQILSATQDHIYLYDRDCRYLFVNPSGARAVGLRTEDMVGRHWREIGLVAEILEPFEERVHRCFHRGERFIERVGYPTVYGHRQYEYSLDPVRDAGGAVAAVLAVVRDITDRCQDCPHRADGGGVNEHSG